MISRMLSREEKKEMLADAMDKSRRGDFRALGIKKLNISTSMDRYINFLHGIQAVYGPFKYLQNPHPTHNNKL